MGEIDQIAELLFSEDARSKAERILATLAAAHGARGGAVLAAREDQLVVFVGAEVDITALAQVRSDWDAVRKRLVKREVIQQTGSVLAALRDGDEVVGALYLEGVREFDAAGTELLRSLLARAVGSGFASAHASAATVRERTVATRETRPAHVVQREKLIDLLQQEEWNVARVSRALGVTRRTIYLRMERYGIERQKVPRTRKPILAT